MGTLDIHVVYEKHPDWSGEEGDGLDGTVETVDGTVADGRLGRPTDQGTPTDGAVVSVGSEQDAAQFLDNTLHDTYPGGHDASNPPADPCAALPDGSEAPGSSGGDRTVGPERGTSGR